MRRPDAVAGINWANPITSGLALAVANLPGDRAAYDLVSRSAGTVGSDFARTQTPFGLGRATTINGGSSPDRWTISASTTSVTLEIIVNIKGLYTGNVNSIQGVVGGSGFPAFGYVRLGDSSGAGKVNAQLGNASKFGTYDWTPHFGRFTLLHLVGRGAVGEVWVNGKLVDTGSTNSQTITTVGPNTDDSGRGSPMDYLSLNAWNRPLSQVEIEARAGDWWGHLIRPDARPLIYAPASAAPPAAPPWLLEHDLSGGYLTMGM